MNVFLKVSGKKHELPSTLEWNLASRPGGWVIATHSRSGKRVRFMGSEAQGRVWSWVAGESWYGEIVEPTRGGGPAASAGDLSAQFPGKVRKVLVKEGASVAEGDPLLLMEAMKMEFAVKAPFAGTVTKVRVKDGQQVSPGDVFIDLEEAPKRENS